MVTKMRRLMFSTCLALIMPSLLFAKLSEKLPLPKELQTTEELPWFGFDIKDSDGTYNGVVNNGKLKEFAKRNNSKRIVFSFFATWCAPCHEGLKRMSDHSDELKKNGILVVLVNVAEKDLENYNYGKIDNWVKKYSKEEWIIGFDKFSETLNEFGLSKSGNMNVPLPKTLVTDADLLPLMLIGAEGEDFPKILWSK